LSLISYCRLYHTHLIIPGARFDSFLQDVVTFLAANSTEIVVIRTCADGIQYCDIPSAGTITQFALDALKNTNLVLGDSSSFQTSIANLRTQGKRLILVQGNSKYDSYSEGAYFTLNPQTIISNFNAMTTAGQAGHDFTVLQCQGTAEGIKTVFAYSATAANGSTSPLMETKAKFDMSTLPWIQANALKNLTAKQNIILMNDFVDGATTYTAYQLSQTRFAPAVGVAQQLQAQKDLEAYRAREKLLEGILAKEAAMNASLNREDNAETLDVFKAAHSEAQATREAQEQVVSLMAKNVAALSV